MGRPHKNSRRGKTSSNNTTTAQKTRPKPKHHQNTQQKKLKNTQKQRYGPRTTTPAPDKTFRGEALRGPCTDPARQREVPGSNPGRGFYGFFWRGSTTNAHLIATGAGVQQVRNMRGKDKRGVQTQGTAGLRRGGEGIREAALAPLGVCVLRGPGAQEL